MASVAADVFPWFLGALTNPVDALDRYPVGANRASPHRRLIDALAKRKQGIELGPRDLVVLLRAVLRAESRKMWASGQSVLVPESIPLPADSVLSQSSIVSRGVRAGGRAMAALPWLPDWMGDLAPGTSPEDPLYERALRRVDAEVEGDPFLKQFGLETYRSSAQRDALRTVLSAPPGTTVIVNLPTGSGKTHCVLIPSLLSPDDTGLLGVTPIVVPTTALALDLERRTAAIVGHATAYRSDLTDVEKHELRQRCGAGTQGPLFLAPEALVGSMHGPLLTAAKSGVLRYFVVDEAHLVTAWGDDFRPEFQRIASVRRELLELAPRGFVTVLLSATLTPYSMQALYDLYGETGTVHQANAVRLRPEPSYWRTRASSSEEQCEWIQEALAHLPRPAILYTTRRRDAEDWYERLRTSGYRRVGLVHGHTPPNERSAVIRRWSNDELDIVVATSAFGLGVDKADVRAVVHATCPESVDRFYQEAGRGGRDGAASASLVVWTQRDEQIARELSSPTFISIGRGFQRWKAMFHSSNRRVLGDGRFSVPLDERPSTNPEDIDMQSDANERWNLRTLLLMQRARLLELDGQSFEAQRNYVSVRILEGSHATRTGWDERVGSSRQELLDDVQQGWELFELGVLRGEGCIAETLQRAYECADRGIVVTAACGGCPSCRVKNRAPYCGRLIPRHSPEEAFPSSLIRTGLQKLFGSDTRALITHESASDVSAALLPLASWLIQQGVRQFLFPKEWRPNWEQLLRGSAVFVDHELHIGVTAKMPRATFAFGSLLTSWGDLWRRIELLPHDGPHVLVIPSDLPQAGAPKRLLRDVLPWPARFSFEQWREGFLE